MQFTLALSVLLASSSVCISVSAVKKQEKLRERRMKKSKKRGQGCDITGLWETIETAVTLGVEEILITAPITNVGRASFDCYPVPFFFGTELTSPSSDFDVATDFIHHPILSFGALVAFPFCMIGQDLEPEIFDQDVGSLCSVELLSANLALFPIGNFLGAALTFPVRELDDVYQIPLEDEFYDDICHHLAAYVFDHQDEDSCFFGASTTLPIGPPVCAAFCGYEVKHGVIHMWANGIFTDPLGDEGRNLHETEITGQGNDFDDVFGSPLGPGFVLHKISNN